MKKKRIWKVIVCIALVILIALLGYAIYLQVTYNRIDDQQNLTINQGQKTESEVSIEQTYDLLSYNVGFGAYSDDYSFFMDGGKYSRAFSKEAVIKNITADIEEIKAYDPDFIFIQEADQNSTRSYHVNEVEMFSQMLPEYANNFALNYHSAYLLYPLNEPHGASNAGLMTLAKFDMQSAVRRSLPISTSVFKFIDLDRCYVTTRLKTQNGKELILYNVHLSAYTVEDDIVSKQIEMVASDMKSEYDKGNYVICGGDFNQDMLEISNKVYKTEENSNSWASPFPSDKLPEGFHTMTSLLSEDEIYSLAPSCRNADKPYDPDDCFVTYVDGFIVSDNVKVLSFNTIDLSFKYSDHNPILMKIELEK